MKNIKEFFTSPTGSKLKSTDQIETCREPVNQNENNKGNIANCELIGKNKPKNAIKSKKKKSRKPSDPLVKDVTVLFSNNLSLISPNTSVSGELSASQHTSNNEQSKDNSLNINLDLETGNLAEGTLIEDITDNTQKETENNQLKDAFQFLMNCRNTIIGQNSNGKTMQVQVVSPDEVKAKLQSRKKTFENWAEQKGALKKRRREEEIENCINNKMVERTKRFKNMLQGENGSNTGKSVKVRKRRVKKISSSESESSNDKLVSEVNSVELIHSDLSTISENNAQDNVKINSTVKENVKQKNNLLNFVGVTKGEEKIKIYDDESNQNNEENKIIKVKMFTSINRKRKTSLPLKKVGRHGSSVKIESIVGKSVGTLNDSIEEFNSETVESLKNHNKKSLRHQKKKKTPRREILNSSTGKVQCEEKPFNKDISENSKFEVCTETDSSKRSLRATRKVVNYKEIVDDFNIAKNNKKSDEEKIEISSDSDNEKAVKKKNIKVAPVFLKHTPKPKIDQGVIEARKKFLMSGIPDSLKRTIEKEKSIEEKKYNIFPVVSHIQQKCDNTFWNLPKPVLILKEDSLLNKNTYDLKCNNLIFGSLPSKLNFVYDSEKKYKIENIVTKIKSENPNYPVYKVFRHISQKFGKEEQHTKKSRRKIRKRSRNSLEGPDTLDSKTAVNKYLPWTEKYRPNSSDEILGNSGGVAALKTFLETWLHYSEEINAKRKRLNSDSESEFDLTDCDSRDSVKLPGNTIILTGPCGCGKTTAVFAIAKELGFNVLELNASSKRTGKKLIQELHEATQSHQVRKHKSLDSMLSNNKSKRNIVDSQETERKKNSKKMCILLLEDIDLVFDQDEGFLSSLSQLIISSKRPIILTTTDSTPAHVQKFINQYECITFMPVYKEILGIWLQIVCLVEGWLVDKHDIGNLLDYNKGDIRKTLLSIQYWCQSGGQIQRDYTLPLSNSFDVMEQFDFELADDEEINKNSNEDKNNRDQYMFHSQCLGSFESFCENKQFKIPNRFDLGKVWWNIPNILNVKLPPQRLERDECKETKQLTQTDKQNDFLTNGSNLRLLLNMYDSLVLTDELYRSVHYQCDEPVSNTWSAKLKDSLELTDRREDNTEGVGFIQDFTHTLVNGYIEEYQKANNINCGINLAVPTASERRWRTKLHTCENFLKQPVPLSNRLDHKVIALDYFPALRHIARTEDKRAVMNTKRRNRFRHYLKNLDMNFSENISKSCCSAFNLHAL